MHHLCVLLPSLTHVARLSVCRRLVHLRFNHSTAVVRVHAHADIACAQGVLSVARVVFWCGVGKGAHACALITLNVLRSCCTARRGLHLVEVAPCF